MAIIIGVFTKVDTSFTGSVKTLTLNVKTKIVPVDLDNNRAPDYRIYSGATEFGGGWTKTARDSDRQYVSVKLDDPSFPKPIYASLVEADDTGDVYNLIWSRPNGD
jgi:uncharacterized protein (DUF736 family)